MGYSQYEIDNFSKPFRYVCYIESTFPNGSVATGTGTVVGKNDVLTAAHVIYNQNRGGFATTIKVVPGYDPNPSESLGTYYGRFTNAYTNFDPDRDGFFVSGDGTGGGRGGAEVDFAIVGLDRNIASDLGGLMWLDPYLGSRGYNITGHPGFYSNNPMNADGFTAEDPVDYYFDIRDFEIHGGNSGGPVWVSDENWGYVAGVVSTGSAAGQIKGSLTDILSWINGNNYLVGTGGSYFIGSTDANVISGTSGADEINGWSGNDVFYGNAGNDLIVAGFDTAADIVYGGTGDDSLHGSHGGDFIYGEDGNDSIIGRGGDDYIEGNSGNDELIDGEGNNRLFGGSGNDIVIGGTGFDTLYGGTGLDNLGGGNSDDAMYGEADNDTLSGGPGNDTLDGGAGVDSLVGGAGNDTFIVDSTADVAFENSADGVGYDGVIASTNYQLLQYFEWLVLSETAGTSNGTGNAEGNSILGNSFSNVLSGGGGNDILASLGGNDTLDGGTGSDVMAGGLGNDVYYVDSAQDNCSEVFGEGVDTAYTSTAYVLGPSVEQLIMFESAGAINAIGSYDGNNMWGNTFNNVIFGAGGSDAISGGAGNDFLSGDEGNDALHGGQGNDTMYGGTGDDVYWIDSLSDVVAEIAGQGSDFVYTTVNYIMGADIENVLLDGGNSISVLGNASNNAMQGNAGNNGIAGGAGNDYILAKAGNDSIDGQLGADTMGGETGIDTYFVDDIGDVVMEVAEAGVFDTVWSTVTFIMPANVEIFIAQGGAAISALGNDDVTLMLGNNAANVFLSLGGNDMVLGQGGNDTIEGGTGNDSLSGGVGGDILTGGQGSDYFIYTSIAEAGDVITDFTTSGPMLDILDLRAMFKTFSAGFGSTSTTAINSGHLTLTQAGANVNVFVDANGGAHLAGEQVLLGIVQNVTTTALRPDILVL
ncbi:MAG: hypothetical protein ACRDBH_05045 [Bosea sp. (in: a-proteobacteria)]